MESKVTNWTTVGDEGSISNNLYQQEIEDIIKLKHPDVEKVVLTDFMMRGPEHRNGPVQGGFHVDYWPHREEFQNYIAEHSDLWEGKKSNFACIEHPVLDWPLVMMDARDVNRENIVPEGIHEVQWLADGSPLKYAVLVPSLIFSPALRFYYWPKMTSNEVMIFRHMTINGDPYFFNMHAGGALPTHLPAGAESRSSVECRAWLFFKKDDNVD